MKEKNNKVYYTWIDFLKGLAILAVVVDHSFGYLYNHESINSLSSYSVTLFILLAGITSYYSLKRQYERGITAKYVLGRVATVFIPYVVASAVCSYLSIGYKFDLKIWVTNVIQFNAAPTFYFVVFYLQLVAVSPIIYKMIRKITDKNGFKQLFQLLLFGGTVALGYWLMQKTIGLELHGGARYILGGSYIAVYTLGMILATYDFSKLKTHVSIIISCVGVVSLFIYGYLMITKNIVLYRLDCLYPQAINNPPGIKLFIYSILIFITFLNIYLVLEKVKIINKYFLKIFEGLGKYSLYIFLYHYNFAIEARNTILQKFGWLEDNVWTRRIIFLFYAIVLPVVAIKIYKWIKKWIFEKKVSKENIEVTIKENSINEDIT